MTIARDVVTSDAPSNVAVLPIAAASSAQRRSMVKDELSEVVAAVCAKFPDRSRAEVKALVWESYEHLKGSANVTAHLIPLTLNRSMRLMRESAERTTDHGDASQCPPLSRRTG
jgi:isopentenyldiphosphate isomerase